MRKRWLMAFVVQLIALGLLTSPALADDGLTRTTWPSAEDPGLPAYAEIEPAPPHLQPNDGERGAVVFYRDPACVPEDFNLLNFFDVPRVFLCESTMEGSSLWVGDPLVGAPKIMTMHGTGAVPVWFVPVDSFREAVEDGELTIGELEAMDGLIKGSAAQYSGVLQPGPLPPELGGGGHLVPKQSITATGELEDGRMFFLEWSGTSSGGEAIRIAFR